MVNLVKLREVSRVAKDFLSVFGNIRGPREVRVTLLLPKNQGLNIRKLTLPVKTFSLGFPGHRFLFGTESAIKSLSMRREGFFPCIFRKIFDFLNF